MERIKFEITEIDIKEYLLKYKDELKNKEAMFVKYMKENKNILTKESLDILMKNYNCQNLVDFDYQFFSYLNNGLKTLPDFSTYLEVQNLDINGLCHIIIPTLNYYKEYRVKHQFISASHLMLGNISQQLNVSTSDDLDRVLGSALENYEMVGKIERMGGRSYGSLIKVIMSEDQCENELCEYESIYGTENVQKIKKIVCGFGGKYERD